MSPDVCARFSNAGLALAIERLPIEPARGLGVVEIVQLDIARRRNLEWFRIYPGHAANRIDVTASNPHQRQLVLQVQEARRSYEAIVDGETKVLHTLGAAQYYLCGQDEAHLFMAQLPHNAATIDHAHRMLAPRVPEEYAKQPSTRQGEWFFYPAIAVDREELERLEVLGYGKKSNISIAEAGRIWRRSRPHIASELRFLKPGRRIFVRGHIKHPDHRTLTLRDWHFVLLNRELTNQRTRWID
jgi:hypothetical protein